MILEQFQLLCSFNMIYYKNYQQKQFKFGLQINQDNSNLKNIKSNKIIMSIYSGFATRHQQSQYDTCVRDLLYVIVKRIVKFYNAQTAQQQKFAQIVTELYQKIQGMEQSKYLDPKISHVIAQLVHTIDSGKLTKYQEMLEERDHFKGLIQKHAEDNVKLLAEYNQLKKQIHNSWKPKIIKQQEQQYGKIKKQQFIIKKSQQRNSSLLILSNRDFKISPENFQQRFKQYHNNKTPDRNGNKISNSNQRRINPQQIDSLVYNRNKNYLRGKSKNNINKFNNTISYLNS